MIENVKAVAADIDMTLTAKGGDLPQATVKAFQVLHENGVMLGLATGRVIEEREKKFGTTWGLGFDFDFVIGMNGGMIYDRKTNRTWQTELLTTEEMKETLSYMMPLVEKYQIPVNCEGGGNINDLAYVRRRVPIRAFTPTLITTVWGRGRIRILCMEQAMRPSATLPPRLTWSAWVC